MIKIFRCALLAFFFALSISFTSAAATDGKLWVNTYAGALGLDLSVNPQPHVVAGGYDIAVDQSTGNLWAYDGLSISSYQSDGTSLASYPVNVYGAMSHLAVDSTIGNIWLTIENKLYIFDLTGTMLNQIELSFNNFQLNLDRKNQLLYLSDDYEVHVFNVLGEKLYTLDLLGGLSLRVFTLDPLQDSVLVLAGDKILRFDAAGNLISQADDSKLDYFKNLSADGRGGFWSASYDFVYHYDAIGGYDFEAFGFKNPDSYGDIGTILTMIADPASDTVWLGSYYDLKHINLQGEALYSLNTYLFEGVEHQIFKMKMYYGDGDSTPSTVPLIEITSPQNGSVFRDTAPQINLAFTPQQSAIDTTSLVLELNQIPVQLDCTVSQSSAQCLFVSFPGVGSHVLRARISNDLGEISQPALLQFEIGTNSAPVINSAPVLNVTAGDLYVYDVNATDTDGDSITYSLSAQAPSTMQIDGVSGLISWQTISTDIGVVAIDVVATDSFGASVTQRFSLTVEEAFILVPDVVGAVQTVAEQTIVDNALVIGVVSSEFSSTVPQGTVISQLPVSGSSVNPGAAVNLVISAGPELTLVPDLVNTQVTLAEGVLTGASLTLGTQTNAFSATVAAGRIISQLPVGGVQVEIGTAVDVVVSAGFAPVLSPNVVGMAQATAQSTIVSAGLAVGTISTGTSDSVAAGNVISQSPLAGISVAAGSAVNLVVSTGPAPVNVPGVVGMAQAAAQSAITSAGLTVGTISTANSDTVAVGDVISQSPTAGTSVAAGSAVNLVVSSGPAPVNVPGVVGMAQAAAQSAITSADLTVGTISTANSDTVAVGDVISQSPTAGTSVAAGSAINLVVSSGPVPISVPNVVGTAQADAESSIISAGLTVGVITIANNEIVAAGDVISQSPVSGALVAPGSAVNIVVSSGPTPVNVPGVVGMAQATAQSAITSAGLTVGTISTANSDTVAVGDVISQSPAAGTSVAAGSAVNLVVSSGPATAVALPLDVTVTASPQIINQGETAVVTVVSNGGIVPVNVALTVDGVSVSLDGAGQYSLTATQAGTVELIANASDTTETVESRGFISVREPTDTVAPVVDISTPGADAEITSAANIIGTASDDNLAEYRLEISPVGKNQFTEIAFGYTQVVNGVLGVFDPGLYTNGLYDIRLIATDVNGLQSVTMTTYQTSGDVKVGNFSFTVTDLTIPVAGIPITVNRTYDTRRKSENLDFGYGWSIDYQDIKIEENKELGANWRQTQSGGFLPTYCIEPNVPNTVSVRLPDGRVERFSMSVSPQCQQLVPPTDVSPVFTATSGTTSQLADTSGSVVRLNGGRLLDMSTIETYNPSRYRLTTLDGLVYQLDQNFGVRSVTDRNGNVLTFSNAGITHSSGKGITFNRDSAGRIISITDPNGGVIEYAYNVNGDLESVLNQTGELTQHRYNRSHGLTEYINVASVSPTRNIYDDTGRLVAQIDPEGNRVDFIHDLSGQFTTVNNQRGFPTQYQYDSSGNILAQVDALSNTTQYTYDSNDNQLSKTDALGNATVFTYNALGQQLSKTDALGNVYSSTYNSFGKELGLTDENGSVITNAYDTNGNLLSITDPLGNSVSNVIGSNGLPSRVTNALGDSTQYVYDSSGQVVTQTDAAGNITNFTYDSNGNNLSKSVTRTVNGVATTETTVLTYDSLNRLVSKTDALGGVTRIEYDAAGNKVRDIDPLGRITEYTYDIYRRVIATTYPDNSASVKAYDVEGNLVSETDRDGNTVTYVYDALNRQTSVVYADGTSFQTEYDALGKVIAEIDSNANRTEYEYDALGRRTLVRDALGNITRFTYDNVGNVVTVTDALNNITRYEYDAVGQKIRTIYPDLSEILQTYDAAGQMTSKTDQNGNTIRYVYDSMNRLIEVTDALTGRTQYGYDEVGNKVSQTDALGRVTTWTFDALGRELSRTLPMGQIELKSYDAAGNMLSHTDFNGQLATYTYDSNNQVSQITYSDGAFETFRYALEGLRTEAVDRQGGVHTWVYDARNRLLQDVKPDGDVIAYQYDNMGNKTALVVTLSAGTSETTTYEYDQLNRLQRVTAGLDVTAYTYNAVGSRESVLYGNGNLTTYSYNTLNRLTGVSTVDSLSAVLTNYQYTLDAAGNRIQLVDQNSRTTTYAYDAMNRLISETSIDAVNGNHTASYVLDVVGNRLSETVNSVTTLSVFDNNDRLTQQGTTLYSYDAAGNAISKTNGGVSTSYTYDVKNELIEQNVAGVISTYAYDVNGIRRAAVNDGNASRYLIDSNRDYAQVIREVSATGTVAYNYGIDLINQSRSGTQSYYLYDGLGTVTGLSDVTGNLSDSYIYDAFGNMLSQTGTTENSYLFAGEQFDSAMNQYYLRARYYDQSAGRFTQQDTWMGINEDPRTLHKYMYANANPVNNIDPTGNFSLVSISISFSIRSVLSTSTRFVTSFAGRTATRDPSATFLSGGVILMGVLAMKPGFDLRNQALEEFVSAPTDELMNKALAKYRFAGQYIAAMAGAIGQMNTLATSALAITQFARALSRIPTSRVNSIAVSRYTQQSITVETNFRDIIVRMSSSTSISVSIIKTITRDITLAIKEAESAFFAIF